MRIVGGAYKGKKLFPPISAAIRPTTDRNRETLFNLLTQGKYGNIIKDIKVLDVFSGTGAIAIEALSRGAIFTHLIDIDLSIAKKNIKNLGLESLVSYTNCSIQNLCEAPEIFSLIICDPPYGKDLVSITLQKLIEKNWIADNAFIFIETHHKDNFTIPAQLKSVDTRVYGKTKFSILKRL